MVLLTCHKAGDAGSRTGKKSKLRTARNERGTSMVEYALLVACIALLVVLPLSRVGASTRNTF